MCQFHCQAMWLISFAQLCTWWHAAMCETHPKSVYHLWVLLVTTTQWHESDSGLGRVTVGVRESVKSEAELWNIFELWIVLLIRHEQAKRQVDWRELRQKEWGLWIVFEGFRSPLLVLDKNLGSIRPLIRFELYINIFLKCKKKNIYIYYPF